MTIDIERFSPKTGRTIKEDNSIVNIADLFNQLKTFLERPSQIDAFGNLRVSEGNTLFDTQFQYTSFDGSTWLKKINGTATLTHLPEKSAVHLGVGTDNGDSIIWQSRRYIRYQPGKSQKIMMTSVLGNQKAGVTKRYGYFDVDNGIFFEQTGTSVNMVLRSKVSGNVVENRVSQENWNVDKMDGNGSSGVNLDSSKAQIFFIDLEWLSVGRVRVGFVVDGNIYYVHYFNHANNITTPYMTTANLPIRYEIFNTDDTLSNTSIDAICCSVQSEGGFIEDRYFPSTINTGITPVSVTTRRPILSIRPKTTFNSIVNRGDINPLDTVLTTASNNVLVEIVLGGTLSGGANAWNSVNDTSITNFNTDHTTITGGKVIESYYVIAGSGATRGQFSDNVKTRLPLNLDIDGNADTSLSIVVTSFTGTATVTAAINWREIY